jgi:Interferon-induced 6-16 family
VALPCLAATTAGFGVAGIVGGSAAAAFQSSVGSVAAGSAFATAQSLGMTGALAAGTTYGAGAVGVGTAARVANWWNGRRNAQDGEEAADAVQAAGEEAAGEEAADDGQDYALLITCAACRRQFPMS